MPLQEKTLGAALGEELQLHSSLCRREAGDFQRAIKGGAEVVVACTQEKRLFGEIGEQTEGAVSPVKFVNIRETGGWSRDASQAMPKLAALLAAAHLPDPEPVPTVTYKSSGRLLVIGPLEAGRTRRWFRERRAGRDLVRARRRGRAGAALPGSRRPHRQPQGLAGRLRAQMDRRQPDRPGPVHALQCLCGGMSGRRHRPGLPDRHGQMRLAPRLREGLRSRGRHRFQPRERGVAPSSSTWCWTCAPSRHSPSTRRRRAISAGTARTWALLLKLREMVGEFEKPKFFVYKQKLCAHSRNETVGCNACIEVCSAEAISSEKSRQQIKVNPNLCVGCGACTTVCPTGALTYAYPRASEQGLKFKTAPVHLCQGRRQDAGAAAAQPGARAAAGGGTGPRGAAEKGQGRARPRDPAGVVAHGQRRRRPVAVGHRFRRLAGLRAGDERRGAAIPGQPEGSRWRWRRPSSTAWATPASTSSCCGPIRRRSSTWACRRWRQTRQQSPAAAARFAVATEKRSTLELALDHLVEHAPARPASHRPARGIAVRLDPGQQGQVHAVPELRRRLPGQRAAGQPAAAAAALHREELRAVRPVRQHLPGRRDHAAAPPAAHARAQGGARAQRNASPMPAFAAASRSARSRPSSPCWASWPAIRCSRARRWSA